MATRTDAHIISLPLQVIYKNYGYLFGETIQIAPEGLLFQIALPYLMRGEIELRVQIEPECWIRCQARVVRQGYSSTGRYAYGVEFVSFEPEQKTLYMRFLSHLVESSAQAAAPEAA
jgi:hypothetical protein